MNFLSYFLANAFHKKFSFGSAADLLQWFRKILSCCQRENWDKCLHVLYFKKMNYFQIYSMCA